MPRTRTLTEWFDGPGFVKWLEARGIESKEIEPSASTMAKWRHGQRVSIWKADEILTRFGYHVDELPEHVRAVSPKTGPRPMAYPPAVREACIRDHRAGVPLSEISRRHGPCGSSVLKWVAEERVPA